MGQRTDFRRGEIESDLKASSLSNCGVDNEIQIEPAEFEMPSRHPGRNSQWARHSRTIRGS